jgi:hypothetical protein
MERREWMWINRQLALGQAVTFCLTEETGEVGVFLGESEKCVACASTARDAVRFAIQMDDRPEGVAKAERKASA